MEESLIAIKYNGITNYYPLKDWNKIKANIKSELDQSINIVKTNDKYHEKISYTKVIKTVNTEWINNKIESTINHLKENDELDAIVYLSTQTSRYRDIIEFKTILYNYYKSNSNTPKIEKKEDITIDLYLVKRKINN